MIKIERLKSRMIAMADIGRTEKGGVTRLALSEEDRKARNLFINWMEDLGMYVRYDDVGNIYGRIEGTDPTAPVIVAGSHLDSVPKGGKFDGVLGVLGALEAVNAILEQGIDHRHPIEIVSFTNEEGARFTPQMLGSGVVSEIFSLDYVYDRQDQHGLYFKDELEKIGFIGERSNRLKNVSAFIELHIEQGPVLDFEQQSIGVVQGISGFSWMEVNVRGDSNHSGSTPMKLRKDSLVTAASIIAEIDSWARQRTDGTVATVGQIHSTPGIINAIAGETNFTIDVRHSNTNQLENCKKEIEQIIKKVTTKNEMKYTLKEIWSHDPVRFSPDLVNVLERICQQHDFSFKRMNSGAGHDAMYISKISETAMIFVPSKNGKSHCEDEDTPWEQIEKGVTVLYETLCFLSTVKYPLKNYKGG
ncbi:Zn-dependent hydrolase [Pseudalkalibacillus sp. A8]|uniref:Zn-dependent hydrolase n=1 Tax=Pseudalkalibacillus sp. A8 TaxID=3382641 RepID=UPI0038B5DA83